MARDSFVLYDNYNEQIKILSMEERGQLLTAIFSFRNEEEIPNMSGATKILFSFIKGQIERDDIKYRDVCEKRAQGGIKGAEFGKLGGRPKKEKSQDLESYEQIIEDMQLSAAVTNRVWEFIRHCQLNGHTLTNDKLTSILVALDMQVDTDKERINLINNAISGGYYDIVRNK